MPLTFPVLIGRLGGRYHAETPALPGWTSSAAGLDAVLAEAKAALEDALVGDLEPTAVSPGARPGQRVLEVTVEEPADWWDRDPSE